MRKKQPVPFSQKFPNADPLALRLLERLLAFDPKDRPTAEEVTYVQSNNFQTKVPIKLKRNESNFIYLNV